MTLPFKRQAIINAYVAFADVTGRIAGAARVRDVRKHATVRTPLRTRSHYKALSYLDAEDQPYYLALLALHLDRAGERVGEVWERVGRKDGFTIEVSQSDGEPQDITFLARGEGAHQ